MDWTTPPVHFALVSVELGSPQYLLELASNCDPPDLSLPSSKDYRCEHLTSVPLNPPQSSAAGSVLTILQRHLRLGKA
jgi:hypothetical protein